jgi:hypothetical protein
MRLLMSEKVDIAYFARQPHLPYLKLSLEDESSKILKLTTTNPVDTCLMMSQHLALTREIKDRIIEFPIP